MSSEHEAGPRTLIEDLKDLGHYEEITVPGRQPVHNFYNPRGIELERFLDKKHPVKITNFNTVIISKSFMDLRGKLPRYDEPSQVEWEGDSKLLHKISRIANTEGVYEGTPEAKALRREYLSAISEAAKELYIVPAAQNEIIVPIERCGGNIARVLKAKNGVLENKELVFIEVKRLRFRDRPDLLGAGINLSPEVANRFIGRTVRLLEGIVATGSTESAVIAAFRNMNIPILAVDCDAVVVCPVGAEMVRDFRGAAGIDGTDCGAFVGGILDENCYARYYSEDSLLGYLGSDGPKFVGKQVIGDGGDLTSI